MRKKEKEEEPPSKHEIKSQLANILGDNYKVTSAWLIKYFKFKLLPTTEGKVNKIDVENNKVEVEINGDYEDELDPKFKKFEEETGMEIVKTVTDEDYSL